MRTLTTSSTLSKKGVHEQMALSTNSRCLDNGVSSTSRDSIDLSTFQKEGAKEEGVGSISQVESQLFLGGRRMKVTLISENHVRRLVTSVTM